jgi:anaerobic sulfatase-maturating enzyme
MQADLLEQYIVQQIEISPEPVISFFWHGGEPTLLGLDFFRKIVELQRKHIPPGRRITNSLQTNGVILNEEWCRFLAAERFSVGLSLDGPQELHDRYRMTKDQKPTHKQAMAGYRLLRQHRVPVDILCVVHAGNVRYPLQVYRFFKDIKAQYISFIPLVELRPPPDSGVGLRTVPADGFGAFLCAIFDEWARQDIGRIMVQIFEEAARPAYGQDHSLCIFRLTCGDVPVIEHNGDFFLAIILSLRNIAWEISTKPRYSRCSKALHSDPLAGRSWISCLVIAGNVQFCPCAMEGAQKIEFCRPLMGRSVLTICVPVINASLSTAAHTWLAWRLFDARVTPRSD